MTKETTRICFVRHGETAWNIELRMQGHQDLALNANGLAQAAAVGRYFAGARAAALYSSDLLRARQTAQPVAEALSLPMKLLTALRERNFGRNEGKTLAEVRSESESEAQSILTRDPDYAAPGGGESLHQHQSRVLGCIAQLQEAHAGQTIVVVTHGGVLDVVFRRANDLSLKVPRDYPIPNAGINWISLVGERWVVESWAETGHLA